MCQKKLLLPPLIALFVLILTEVHGLPHIVPSGDQGERDTSENHIDVSGLGEGIGFYSYNELEIQVLVATPVWTFQNANMSHEMFVGHNENKTMWCSLFRFVADDGTDTVTTGTVKDTVNGIWYVMKRNAIGEQIVITKLDQDFPDEGDAIDSDNPVEDMADSIDPVLPVQNNVTIRLMVLWTKDAECTWSGLVFGCSVTEITRANIQAQAAALVAEANTVHSNTLTGVRFEARYARETTYIEGGYVSPSLEHLAEPSDGYMDYIHSWR